MKKRYPKIVKVAIISVYLIFLAGAVVRMTGSGMGCPDWPKCFGYYIPPTSETQITWAPNTNYKKGIIIIKDEALFVAEKNIQTKNTFNPNNWAAYTKHDYNVFNKYHTWTEYINRLMSVLSGFVFLYLMWATAIYYRKYGSKQVLVYAIIPFLLMAFQAWLGKKVVDSNLTPTVITIHMVVGLLIIGLLIKLQFITEPSKKVRPYNALFNKLLVVSVVFSLIQIAMGTQVRQFIDEQVKLFGFENKNHSLMNPNFKFYFHRSFTIAIVLVNMGLFYINQVKNLGYKLINWVLFLIFLEAITGILMYYAAIPIGTQAIHLMAGAILFGLQFYLWLQNKQQLLKSKLEHNTQVNITG